MHVHRRVTLLALMAPLAALALSLSGCTAVPPSAATAVAGDGFATVSFDSKTPGDAFEVLVSPGFASHLTKHSPVRIGGLENGTAYTFTVRVRGANRQWSEWSAPTAPVVPKGAPGAPSVAGATGIVDLSGCTARVAVTPGPDGGSPITGYEVSVDGLPPVQHTTSPIDVPGLTAHASYSVTVRAINALGASAASAPVAGTCS